jgi:tRNA threonylcarbamoyladenosine biosynthesis protein TsaB
MAPQHLRESMTSAPAPRPDGRPILCIDTSSGQGSVALYDGQMLSTRSWPADRSHTTTLLPEIHHLFDRAGISLRELAAVAIAIGPGTFTGLRVGFGVAKGFHLATGVPLIGVPTLEATALAFASCGAPVVAVVGVGRGRLVWARHESSTAGLTQSCPSRNGTVSELVTELNGSGRVLVTGEIDEDQAGLIDQIDGVSIPPAALRMRHPGAIAEVAWRRWQAGEVDDASALEPVYLSR